jgi:hypothetical protein
MFGVAIPRENTPNTTPKKQAKISPEVYTYPD